MSWMPQTERIIFDLAPKHWHKWYCPNNEQVPNRMDYETYSRFNKEMRTKIKELDGNRLDRDGRDING